MIKSKNVIVILLLIAGYNNYAGAQNFSYALTKDSSSYADLSGATTALSGESFANKHPVVHLPFTFNFCGFNADSVVIETNGFIVFNVPNAISLISFNGFSGYKDSLQQYVASINYLLSGSSGNRIMKIEFRKLSNNAYSFYDNLSYQVWLYENGNKVEYHIGPSYYSSQVESEYPVLMGPINQKMDTDDKAFMISGNPVSPTGS